MSRSAAYPNKAPYMVSPDNALRRKIGMNVPLSEIFTVEKIQACQQMLDSVHVDFLKEIEEQVTVLGDAYMKAANDPQAAAEMLQTAADLSFTIKTRMETLGFSFGFAVAKSLYEYIQVASDYSPDILMVVCKHVAILNLIIKEKITGDGGQLGQETIANLKKLVKKKAVS